MESYIAYFVEPLGNGRAVMRVDIVVDGVLVDSHLEGSPAPIETVRRYERKVTLL